MIHFKSIELSVRDSALGSYKKLTLEPGANGAICVTDGNHGSVDLLPADWRRVAQLIAALDEGAS